MLPFAAGVARGERALASGGRGAGGYAPDTPSEIHWGWGLWELNLVVECPAPSLRDRSYRPVTERSCPGGAAFGDGHSATLTAPASPPGFSSWLISCSGKSFASPSPLPPWSPVPLPPPRPLGLPGKVRAALHRPRVPGARPPGEYVWT